MSLSLLGSFDHGTGFGFTQAWCGLLSLSHQRGVGSGWNFARATLSWDLFEINKRGWIGSLEILEDDGCE